MLPGTKAKEKERARKKGGKGNQNWGPLTSGKYPVSHLGIQLPDGDSGLRSTRMTNWDPRLSTPDTDSPVLVRSDWRKGEMKSIAPFWFPFYIPTPKRVRKLWIQLKHHDFFPFNPFFLRQEFDLRAPFWGFLKGHEVSAIKRALHELISLCGSKFHFMDILPLRLSRHIWGEEAISGEGDLIHLVLSDQRERSIVLIRCFTYCTISKLEVFHDAFNLVPSLVFISSKKWLCHAMSISWSGFSLLARKFLSLPAKVDAKKVESVSPFHARIISISRTGSSALAGMAY